MGVALRDQGGTLQLALRARPDLAQHMAGFDPIALAVPTGRLGEVVHSVGRVGRGARRHRLWSVGWVLVGLCDPDGIEVRLYTVDSHDEEGRR